MLVTGREVAEWAIGKLDALGYETWPVNQVQAMGVVRGRRLIAGVIYSDYQPRYRSLVVSIVADSPLWATRANIWALLAYPFEQMRCQRITSSIRADNERSIKLCRGLGFVEEGRVRRGYGDLDAIVLGLLAEEWRAGRYGGNTLGREQRRRPGRILGRPDGHTPDGSD